MVEQWGSKEWATETLTLDFVLYGTIHEPAPLVTGFSKLSKVIKRSLRGIDP